MSQNVNWEQKISVSLRQCKPEKGDKICRVIVELSGEESDEIMSIISANHGRLQRKNGIISALVVEVPFSAIQALANSKQVKKIWSDDKIKACR